MNTIKQVMGQYGINSFEQEQKNGLYKIKTAHTMFALKEVNKYSIQKIDAIYQQSFQSFAPIFVTKFSQPFVQAEGRFFYLMPWLSKKRRDDTFITDLAIFHNRTEKEITWSAEQRREFFQMMKQQWQYTKINLEKTIEKFEKEWYMSPTELQITSYYIHVVRALSFAQMKLEQWFEKTSENKIERYCFTNIPYLTDQKGHGFFTNIEETSQSFHFIDLIQFFHYKLTEHVNIEKCIHWLALYEKQRPFIHGEKELFFGFLAQPVFLLKEMNKAGDEREKSVQLQKAFLQLKNAEKLIADLEKDHAPLQS